MKYLYQFFLIALIAFLGELCYYFIPFKIPSSIYGLLILAFCLFTKIIKLEKIEAAADFLLSIMPILFVPPAVALIDILFNIKDDIFKFLLIIFISTLAVIISTGLTAEWVIKFTEYRKICKKNIRKSNKKAKV